MFCSQFLQTNIKELAMRARWRSVARLAGRSGFHGAASRVCTKKLAESAFANLGRNSTALIEGTIRGRVE